MNREELHNFIKSSLAGKELIIVTNREPYVHRRKAGKVIIERSAGGVATALDDILALTGGIWLAWGSGDADRETVDEDDTVMVPPDNPAYRLKRVWLQKRIADNYYNGFSNRVLWPLCHISLDRVYYRRRYWEDYIKANFTFTNAISAIVNRNSLVWLHDYHLCMVPGMLRERFPDLTIAHFWHIPWPDWDVFRAAPQAMNILEGLLGNDLIGFQIPLFVKNFLECVDEALDAEVDYENSIITYRGRKTFLSAFPISVDFEKFDHLSSAPETERSIKRLRKRYNLPQMVGLGVDRLEYTKGLLKRLQALNLFFEKYEKFRGKFTFIQIAVPTRLQEPYLSYKKSVEALISRIQKRFGRDDWTPILYISKKLDQKELVTFYRIADLAVISSLYDGMNLVAKEYVASQTDNRGALILSGLAGAAEELEGAIRVNPYDIENFADSINIALRMPREEKRIRMQMLRKQISDNDIHYWITDVLRSILSISEIKSAGCEYAFDRMDRILKRLARRKPFFFLDYDGTLSPIVDTPDEATLPPRMKRLLRELSSSYPVTIITGRTLDDIRKRVGIKNIIYAGNHGAEIWENGQTAHIQQPEQELFLIREVLEKLTESLSDIKGVYVEDKGITVSIHYRNVWTKDISEVFSRFWSIMKGYEGRFRVTSGKKVFEIRPFAVWNKGDAVKWILRKHGKGFLPIYIGDDVTDEDAYSVLRKRGITLHVGPNSKSDYYLEDIDDVYRFLSEITSLRRNRS